MKSKMISIFSQTHLLFIIIATLFGLIYSVTTPPLWGIDEPVHFARAYQVSGGNLLFEKDPGTHKIYGALLPKNVIDLSKYVKSDLADNKIIAFDKRKDIDSAEVYEAYKQLPINGPKSFVDIFNVAQYNPLPYLPSAIAIAFARIVGFNIGSTITLARWATLAFYIGVVFFSLMLLKHIRAKWLVFTIALLPTALHQASIINSDATVNALTILLFSLIIYWINNKKPSKRLYAALLTTSMLLPLAKPNYILLSLIFPTVYLFRSGSLMRTRLIKVAIASIAIFLPLVIWTLLAKNAIAVPQQPTVNAALQAHFILSHPSVFFVNWLITLSRYETGYLFGMISVVGFNQIPAPTVAEIYGFIVLFVASIIARNPGKPLKKSYPIIFLAASVTCYFSIFLALYLTYNPVASATIDGVQGRYFIPLIPFALYGAIQYFPIRITASDKFKVIYFSASSSLLLISSLIYFLIATY